MGQVQVEWTKVPRKMSASCGVRAAHMAAAGQREFTGQGGRTRRRAVPAASERELLALGARPAPASPGDRLPPAGRAQGLAPCLLDANRICLLRVGSSSVGCGFPPHPCVGFGCFNSLSYRNQATLTCFHFPPTLSSLSLLYS